MLKNEELSAILGLERLIYELIQEIQYKNEFEKSVVVEKIGHGGELLELLDDIFGRRININYDTEVFELMSIKLQDEIIHDGDYNIKDDKHGLLVLISASAGAMRRIAYKN